MRIALSIVSLQLSTLFLSAAASPGRHIPKQISSSERLRLLVPRSRDSDPADRNPFGLPYTYEGHRRVYRTDILRETGQQPKWLQEKEASKKRMEALKMRQEEHRAGHVSGSPSGHHGVGSSQSKRPYVSALREKATSSAKGAVKAGKGVIRSAKGALRKGFCFMKNC
ncbi:hypothetical protein BCV69DRAFT_295828 [Microstroma glucosiphilum]|uniref:Uncharacterized protein n=1 Tax=Pseudomicrostroma glucosiphilum TaxID=1684307 RepID=A0A316UE09_9BASI|nr:hypothetical protein BCV69DRAFT_295828 [Pseudomicrostroma glucosiphilum]PWN23497.1 hypothetical protein BCV69DRAFT_295828 [Pseudomicrostroma glucosiphilum]